jgi:formyltetrahydrofolate deformylase
MTSNIKDRAVLLLSCPDQKGIVAEISTFVYHYNGNILHSEQHTDYDAGTFFMRVEWELDGFQIPRDRITEAFSFIAGKFNMDYRIRFSTEKTRMAIMVSKLDHCLYDLLLRHKAGEYHAEIVMIISNHKDLSAVAEYFGIPFRVFPVTADNRETMEPEEIELLKQNQIDLVVLARYMQILSPAFVEAFPCRIINIHHSFLPAFVGAKPYHQAFRRGVKLIGATSHYVTEVLDNGPIIEQDVAQITHRESVEDLVRTGKDLEKLVLSRAVKRHLQHKTLVYQNRTVVFH